MTNQDFSGMGSDVYFGDPDDPQPDWREKDDDDGIDDNDDPAPISSQILIDMLGFDPNESDEESDDDELEDEEEFEDEDEDE